jgi:hydrogenase large subunit
MAKITIIDPLTRVEGHLKVQVTIDTVKGKQQVTDARCTGTQFRGFEKILVGRDTRDAPYITQRICGVCPVSHTIASCMAIEQTAGVIVPANARILRNLVLGANFIQSHLLHFYFLSALDYITPPASAPWAGGWNVDLMRSPSMRQISTNFISAGSMRREAHEMAAIFAGRMPGLTAIQPGGFTTKPTAVITGKFTDYLKKQIEFIKNSYIPDAELLSSKYSDYHHIGRGPGNLIAFGGFELDDTSNSDRLFKRGVVFSSKPTSVEKLSTANITEMVTNSWYADSTNNANPAAGKTETVDPAAKPAAYSWIKAPRYSNLACEGGPLARMWVNGDYRAGISVMDRHVARAYEAKKIADEMLIWLSQLKEGAPEYVPCVTPFEKAGEGLTESSRGALGHWPLLPA